MIRIFLSVTFLSLVFAFAGCDSCKNNDAVPGVGTTAATVSQAVQNTNPCASGTHLDPNGACVQNVASCSAGTHLDPSGNCVTNMGSCLAGTHLDPSGNCIADITPQ